MVYSVIMDRLEETPLHINDLQQPYNGSAAETGIEGQYSQLFLSFPMGEENPDSISKRLQDIEPLRGGIKKRNNQPHQKKFKTLEPVGKRKSGSEFSLPVSKKVG